MASFMSHIICLINIKFAFAFHLSSLFPFYQLKLEKSCEDLTSQLDLYQSFLDRMNRWLSQNGLKAEELFRKFDTNQDGMLTYDEFKAGNILKPSSIC